MCTPSAGKPKKMKNSWTTNGVLRIASTYAPISGRKRTAARASALYAAAPSTPTAAPSTVATAVSASVIAAPLANTPA